MNDNLLTKGEHRAQIRDIEINYFVRGQGPLLLLQPGGAGWGGDNTIYLNTLQELEEIRTLIYLDPRGIGKSQKLENPAAYSIEEYVEDLEALRQYFGIDKIDLAGHSHGGFVSLKYAARYPQNVNQLLLMDTTPSTTLGDDNQWMAQQPNFAEVMASIGQLQEKELTPEENLKETLKLLLPVRHFFNYDSIAANFEKILEQTSISPAPFGYFSTQEVTSYNVIGELGYISASTLIIAGEHEVPSIEIGSQILNDKIPDSKLVVIKNSGHWPMLEAPDKFFSVIKPFLVS